MPRSEMMYAGFSELLKMLRAKDWMVAVHNDYHQDGKLFTFWLFTKNGRAVKGEAETDYKALEDVIFQITDDFPQPYGVYHYGTNRGSTPACQARKGLEDWGPCAPENPKTGLAVLPRGYEWCSECLSLINPAAIRSA